MEIRRYAFEIDEPTYKQDQKKTKPLSGNGIIWD